MLQVVLLDRLTSTIFLCIRQIIKDHKVNENLKVLKISTS